MALTDNQFYAHYGTYSYLITEMEDRLLNAKMKSPYCDYSEAEEKIKSLQNLRDLFHIMWHEQLNQGNIESKIIMERGKLLSRIFQLEKENEILKQTIK
tara:strand:+ start:1754 stop:2050 length:297 start_codon:yes stop_codon:yes gene_type:complete